MCSEISRCLDCMAEPTTDKSHEDNDEKQAEMPLLDSLPKTEVKQPKKKKMPAHKKKSASDEDAAGGGDASMYDITLEQLSGLMEVRGKKLMEKLGSSEYNGVKGVLEKLKVDGNKGLEANNEQDLEQRRTAFGRNEIPPKPMKTFIRLSYEALKGDLLLIFLLICAVVSIGLSFYKAPQQAGADQHEETNLEWIEGVAILVAVLVVVFVTAFNDWRKERQFRGLQDKVDKEHETSVVRDNQVVQIPVTELVVGDLCFIKYGDLLPADGLVVQSSDLKTDESSITGETDLIKKSVKEDVGLLSGTHVMEGSGRMLVVGVGLNSQVGKIMSLLGATGGGDSKKKKKDKKKDEKKKDTKSKGKSSTKVSPDASKPDENENDSQTVRTENETTKHPRTHKLPPLQQSNNDEQEPKPTKKENNDNQQKKTPSSSQNSLNESKKKSTNEEQQKKESGSNENSDDEQKKKQTKSQDNDQLQKKKSTSGENINNESDNQNEEQKKKLTKTQSSDEEKEKKSDASKQKQDGDRPATSTSVEPKVSDGDKKNSKKKSEDGKDAKDDAEKKPVGLAALAKEAEKDGGKGGSKDGKSKSKDGKQKSVLQAKLTKLALNIGYIGMAAAALTLICLIIRFCITNYVVKKNPASAGDVSYFISFLIQAITVVVVAVPEGLPLAVTLALAYAVRKMMTDNNLVRHLDACETMGNASTICSDKTGTLTTNRMTVVQCYFNGKYYDKLPKNDEMNKDLLPILFEAITVNSNYTTKIEKAKDEGGLPKQVGNKTECALLDLILNWGGKYDEIREKIPQEKLVKVYTFNSEQKRMSTIIQRDDGYRVYTKGASEMVLAKCKQIIGEDNQPKDLNDDEKKKLQHDVIKKMATDGLRAIGIAYRDLGKDEQNWDDEEKIVNDLICLGIVGIEDPVRDEVPKAIEQCQKAGVTVRMVTGDYIETARSIATKCGIIKPDDDFLVLEGEEFNKRIRDSSGKISQQKLDEVWPKLRVLARSSPTDKYNLVNGIVESQITAHREVVAVTGDGTNDGPALKRADVGFAMGIQGTDVAKQASDIILTDDNFSSIVKAMMWGRNVYDCIAKFLQFQLTANLSAGVISVVSAAAISTVPLRAVQMLWVNLVMDTLASLALATEPPTEELLNRKPYGRTKSIISPLMIRNILGQSLYQLTIMFVILYAGQYFLGVESTVQKLQNDPNSGREISDQFTLVFNAFVLMTLFNEINSRKLHGERNVFAGIFRNPFFYCIWLSCFAAQILIVTFGGQVFSCAQLDIKQWAWCLLFGIGSLIWQQILLFIPIGPFSKCFSALYRVCCPCLYKKQKKYDDDGKEKSDEHKPKKERSSKPGEGDIESDDDDIPLPKYPTIGQLTNATVVTVPPPAFARFMLRRSVDRLNSEFLIINTFRSRLEELKDKREEENRGLNRNNQDDILEE